MAIRLRSSRHGADAIERDVGVPGDEDEPFGLRLGNQHPIERVAVMRWKGACLLGMLERHEQRREALPPDPGLQIVRRLQLPERPHDGDLPAADHAEGTSG